LQIIFKTFIYNDKSGVINRFFANYFSCYVTKISLFNTKILFKELVTDVLPDKILSRKKQGFTPHSISDWIKDKNISEINSFLDNIYKLGLIDKYVFDFCVNRNLKQQYKIRVYLLKIWFNRWILDYEGDD